jgi:hypothetical protein
MKCPCANFSTLQYLFYLKSAILGLIAMKLAKKMEKRIGKWLCTWFNWIYSECGIN